ncbi:MAG TPA: GGDEF domain-containing protein [Allosphingosinicella sp.]|nr:GGDEF domain-containing protein [Allosphingosinicella sp.]
MDGSALFNLIGKFLKDHGLWPSPDNYALVHALMADESSPAAQAVRIATADGIRLSQKEADRIKAEVGLPVAHAVRAGVDPALFAAATQEVERFAAIVEAQRADAQSYGADLAAGADKLESGEGGVAALVAITRAMAERTKTVEQQLTAARDETQQLKAKLAEAGEEARSDPLTGLPNRRAFEERLAELEKSEAALSLAICDIDHFKRVNDTYGHAVGDRVIRAVAQTLRDNCGGNMVARIGGEEFVVLFPGLEPVDAGRILDGARDVLGARYFKLRETDQPLGKVTFSGGVARGRHPDGTPALQRADALLYAAKNGGRNQVFCEAA